MDRDDISAELRAALGDLAASVESADGSALSAVRERGRRQRHRRAGAITSVTSAALVVIVVIGVAIAGHDHSPDVTATGPAVTSTTPTTAAAVCTVGDLTSRELAPMPAAGRVTNTEFSDGAELEPPDPYGGGPVVASPATVWHRAKVALTPSTSYQLLLAVFTGPYPSATPHPLVDEVLSWVIVRRHYPIDVRERSFVPQTDTGTVTPPPCFFGTRYDVYSAETGAHLLTSTVTDG